MQVSKAVEDEAFNGVKWQSLLILIAFVVMMCIINIIVNTTFSCLLCMRSPYIKVMLLMVRTYTIPTDIYYIAIAVYYSVT